VKTGAEGEDVI